MTDVLQTALELDPSRVQAVLSAQKRPYVTLKAAITLDGKIASRHGESRWITGEAARAAGRSLRARHGGVLVGINTVLADDPQLTVRDSAAGPNPVRIVLDSRCRIPVQARCLAADGIARMVVAGTEAPQERVRVLRSAGVQVLICPTARPRPGDFLPQLRACGIETLLVEGGGQVHADVIAHHAADALFLFVAGRVLGDAAAPGWCATLPGGNRLADAATLELAPPLAIGADLLVRGHFFAR
jgi:diaminohydroxyphosphoribosylaminopyrimidine deaminase/5-amino-6-(5-phosphoribosylamino)uracil reductase